MLKTLLGFWVKLKTTVRRRVGTFDVLSFLKTLKTAEIKSWKETDRAKKIYEANGKEKVTFDSSLDHFFI